MMSWPGSPRTRMRPMGPASPMLVALRPRTFLAGGRSARSGLWPSRVCIASSPAARHAAGLEKVSLHIDDQKRAMVGRQFKGIGLGGDFHEFVHFRIHPRRRLEKGLHAYRSRALARFSARQRTFSSSLSFLSNNRARMGG